jgi:WD40 repeat protein
MAELERASGLLAGGVVRVWGPDGQAKGGGVLVGSRHVVTCAHVVAAVIPGSRQEQQQAPVGTVMVDFPALASHEPLRAHPLKEGWCPVDGQEGGDIAVLELDDRLPPGAAPPPLLRPPRTTGRRVVAEGFPVGYSGRITSENRVVADAGPGAGEWLQLADGGTNGFRIDHGYSGTPLWDPDVEAVLGIALGKDGAERGAFMIPTRVLAKAWPALVGSIGWRVRFDPERDEHWRPRARGVATSREEGWLFTGREELLRDLVGWIGQPDGRARVVTGIMGSGKSAVLSRLVTLSDSEEREKAPIEDAPAGTVPPVGSVALAIDVAGMSLMQVVRRIGRWLDVEADTAEDLRRELLRRRTEEPGPLIVIDQLDAAADPEKLVTHILRKLAEDDSVRLLIGLMRREDCPLARGLEAHAVLLELDGAYRDDRDMEEYVRRLLRQGGEAGYAADTPAGEAADRVAKAVTRAAAPSFVVAQLSAMWHREQEGVVERPGAYPKKVTEALDEYLEMLSRKLARSKAQRPACERRLRDLLTALAYARGPGLPVEGPSWPSIAEAIDGGAYTPQDVTWLIDGAAGYLLQSVDAEGERGRRLFHEALRVCLREGRDDATVEAAVVARLADLCDRRDRQAATRYAARQLPAHVGAIDAWDSLAARPNVLDRLDPGAVRAEALRTGLQQGSLPPAIEGVVRSSRLMARSGLADRSGLRQLGMARGSRRRRFGQPDTAEAIAAWTIRSAVVRQDAAQLTLDAPAPVHAVTTFLGADGAPMLAAGCEDGSVRLWSAATGEPFGDPLRGDAHHDDGVRALAACDAGSGVRLLVAMRRGSVRVWDPMRAEELPPFNARHPGGARSIAAFVSEGGLCVATGGDDDELRVWDEQGDLLLALAGSGPVRALAVGSFEGNVCVLAGSDDGRVRVWEGIAGRVRAGAAADPVAPTRELVGPLDWIRGVCAFDGPGGLWIAASGDERKLTLWRPRECEPAYRLRTRDQRIVLGLAPYRDGEEACIATCGASASVELWSASRAGAVGQPLTGDPAGACAVTTYEIGGAPRILTGGEDRTIRIWNPAGVPSLPGSSAESREGPVHAVAALDGVVVTGGADGAIRAWDPSSGEPVAEPFDARVGAIRVLLGGPHGGVAVGGEEVVRFLDPLTGGELAGPLVGHAGAVRALVAGLTADDGRAALATAGDDGTVRLWRLGDGGEIVSARSRHRGPVRALVALEIPGAGACIAVLGEDRSFAMRRVAGGTIGAPFLGHTDWPMAACSYPAAGVQALVTAGDDRTVRDWNPYTGRPRALCGRHDGAVRAVVAAVRGQDVRIVSGGEDRTVRVWDPGAPPGSQETHTLRLGVRVNALALLDEVVLVGTDEGHLVVELI